ncbi:hypothetical protein C0992_002200 [Termitomyces sp. T32_za158]|nr:hypothetical protein C0992_002200 [Termitomyces sp. T32_za158]
MEVSGAGRRVTFLVPFSRSNSTASAPGEPVTSSPKPRIVNSWGNINIRMYQSKLAVYVHPDALQASRDEILKKDKDTSYKPDLTYLASRGTSGFAGRLAANLTSSPRQSAGNSLDGSQITPLEIYQTPEEKYTRIQAITAARRTEREARERAATLLREAEEAAEAAEIAATSAASEKAALLAGQRRAEREARERAAILLREAEEAAQAAAEAARIAARTAASEKSALLTDQRRAERLRREASMTPRQRLAYDASPSAEHRPREAAMYPREGLTRGAPVEARREPHPNRVSPMKARSVSKPSRFPRKPKFRIQSMPSQDANLANANDDITLEIIENGGDDKEPPEFTVPDVSFTDFGNLFRPSFERSVETMIRSPEASFSPGQIRLLREAYGGDYQRLASQTTEDYVKPPHQLGPLKHAQSVLSHRSDVSAGARINALKIISAAVGGTASARTTKAIVS